MFSIPVNEELVVQVDARRKGKKAYGERLQKPCLIGVTIFREDGVSRIALRTEDDDGVPPIVALLSPEESERLERGFAKAREIVKRENE